MAEDQRAINLLTQLYIMCCEAGDFSNGVEHQGIDEGRVQAGRFLAEVAAFLKGRDADYDAYAALYVSSDEDAKELDPEAWTVPF